MDNPLAGHKCDVCGINEPLGVACSPFGAVSFAYCSECLHKPADAEMMFAYLYVEVAGRDLSNLQTEIIECYYTFRDGEYIKFADWVEKYGKHIPEEAISS